MMVIMMIKFMTLIMMYDDEYKYVHERNDDNDDENDDDDEDDDDDDDDDDQDNDDLQFNKIFNTKYFSYTLPLNNHNYFHQQIAFHQYF